MPRKETKTHKKRVQRGRGLLDTKAHQLAIPAALMLTREIMQNNRKKSGSKKNGLVTRVSNMTRNISKKGNQSLKNISHRMRRMVTGGKRKTKNQTKKVNRRKQKGGFVRGSSDQIFPGCDAKADRTSIPTVMDKMNQILADNQVEQCRNT